jgi:hypothetical protein
MRAFNSLSSRPAACALALLLAGGVPLAAQTAEPAPSVQPPAAAAEQEKPDAVAPIRGELIDVDAERKTLSVMTASGSKVQFIYNDATQVSGARDGVAGLATMKNVQVAVHFSEDAAKKTRTATRIEVQPKPVAAPQAAPDAQPRPDEAPSRD